MVKEFTTGQMGLATQENGWLMKCPVKGLLNGLMDVPSMVNSKMALCTVMECTLG